MWGWGRNGDVRFRLAQQHTGFPIRPDLWDDGFLQWDYIGAPWTNGVVGNGALCLESRKMMDAKLTLPRQTEQQVPDNYICYTHSIVHIRAWLMGHPSSSLCGCLQIAISQDWSRRQLRTWARLCRD